jgi:hypothetical protein
VCLIVNFDQNNAALNGGFRPMSQNLESPFTLKIFLSEINTGTLNKKIALKFAVRAIWKKLLLP